MLTDLFRRICVSACLLLCTGGLWTPLNPFDMEKGFQMGLLRPASAFVAHDRNCINRFGCRDDIVGFDANIPTVRDCQRKCDDNPKCNYFTHRSKGIFRNFCFYYAECTALNFECNDCYAGPRSEACPLKARNYPI